MASLDFQDNEFKPADEVFGQSVDNTNGHSRRPSFLSEASVENNEEREVTAQDKQTPQTNRKLPQINNSSDLFSPGSFFASRSGSLGQLGDDKIETRVL